MKPRYGKKGIKNLTAGGRGEVVQTHLMKSLRDTSIRWTTKAPPEEQKPHFQKTVIHKGRSIILFVLRCQKCSVRYWNSTLLEQNLPNRTPRIHFCRYCMMKTYKKTAPSFVMPLNEIELRDAAKFMKDQGVTFSFLPTHADS